MTKTCFFDKTSAAYFISKNRRKEAVITTNRMSTVVKQSLVCTLPAALDVHELKNTSTKAIFRDDPLRNSQSLSLRYIKAADMIIWQVISLALQEWVFIRNLSTNHSVTDSHFKCQSLPNFRCQSFWQDGISTSQLHGNWVKQSRIRQKSTQVLEWADY